MRTALVSGLEFVLGLLLFGSWLWKFLESFLYACCSVLSRGARGNASSTFRLSLQQHPAPSLHLTSSSAHGEMRPISPPAPPQVSNLLPFLISPHSLTLWMSLLWRTYCSFWGATQSHVSEETDDSCFVRLFRAAGPFLLLCSVFLIAASLKHLVSPSCPLISRSRY